MGAFKRIAPISPARDVGRSLEHYGRLCSAIREYDRGGYGFVTRDDIEIHLGLVPDDAWAGPSSSYLWVEDADGLHRRGVPSEPMSVSLKTPSGDSTRVLQSSPTEPPFDSDRRSEIPAPGDDHTRDEWSTGLDGTTRWQPTKTRAAQRLPVAAPGRTASTDPQLVLGPPPEVMKTVPARWRTCSGGPAHCPDGCGRPGDQWTTASVTPAPCELLIPTGRPGKLSQLSVEKIIRHTCQKGHRISHGQRRSKR